MDLQLHEFDTGPDVSVTSAPSGAYERWGKRLIDVSLVVLATPLILPLVAICACLVAADGGNPFFRQMRVGHGGVPFRMLKLRSMCVDAEARLAQLLHTCPTSAAEWHASQKLHHDPRVTKLGAFLRKTSLDELPQLWNVLRGDMSLVGPRPMMPTQAPLYPGLAYFRLRPGVTGPWQIFARNH